MGQQRTNRVADLSGWSIHVAPINEIRAALQDEAGSGRGPYKFIARARRNENDTGGTFCRSSPNRSVKIDWIPFGFSHTGKAFIDRVLHTGDLHMTENGCLAQPVLTVGLHPEKHVKRPIKERRVLGGQLICPGAAIRSCDHRSRVRAESLE
jgi:hypothetical protein